MGKFLCTHVISSSVEKGTPKIPYRREEVGLGRRKKGDDGHEKGHMLLHPYLRNITPFLFIFWLSIQVPEGIVDDSLSNLH